MDVPCSVRGEGGFSALSHNGYVSRPLIGQAHLSMNRIFLISRARHPTSALRQSSASITPRLLMINLLPRIDVISLSPAVLFDWLELVTVGAAPKCYTFRGHLVRFWCVVRHSSSSEAPARILMTFTFLLTLFGGIAKILFK